MATKRFRERTFPCIGASVVVFLRHQQRRSRDRSTLPHSEHLMRLPAMLSLRTETLPHLVQVNRMDMCFVRSRVRVLKLARAAHEVSGRPWPLTS